MDKTLENLLEAWDQSAAVLELLQHYVQHTNSPEELLSHISIEKNPNHKELLGHLTIVHQQYGQGQRSCKIEAGIFRPDGRSQKGMEIENHADVIKVIEGSVARISLETKQDCEDRGFGKYSAVLIVPMHLDDKRNIGAFIFHSGEERKYSHTKLQHTFDVFSNRSAFFICQSSVCALHDIWL